ncbi:unnamed protein product, partial [Cuscuta campestris]
MKCLYTSEGEIPDEGTAFLLFCDALESGSSCTSPFTADMIFFPIMQLKWCYCVCVNIKANKVEVLDLSSSSAKADDKYEGMPASVVDMYVKFLSNQGLEGLNPKASEFHPSTIPGGREESKSKTLDDSGKAFPILPIADPDQTCGMNSSANTIPLNKGVPLAELDPGPISGEDDIEEVWSDEGYASPIGDEDFFSSPMSEDKSKNNITEIPTETPAANTRKGASKTKPPKPPTRKKSGKTRTSPLPKQLINGFHTCVECKIWIFWKDTYSIDLLTNEDQVVFVKATQLSSCRNSVIAFVYAKTKSWLRKDLWNSLVQFAQSHDNATPWAVKAWGVNVTGPPMFQLYAKLKATMLALSKWNKEVFGNIFLKLEELEANVQQAEEVYQQENSDENLLKLKAITAQYTHQLHLEEMFWKQKAHIQWIEGGDRNSKITDEDNQQLVASPSLEEVKDAVFSLNPNSAAGPDGFTGHFFQKCWDIIHLEIFAMVCGFFKGDYMTKGIAHTAIVLLPKVDSPNTFADFRPISLCNFSSKIISKVMASRLAGILPHVISSSQSGFIQGRSISENILITQELCHGMQLGNRDIVLKLDMAKAYDRVSWSFLIKIQRQLGFCEQWIDMVFRMLSNIWYTVLINGHREGFFTSSRGLRQWDPLSPSLFIITAEFLSQILNQR